MSDQSDHNEQPATGRSTGQPGGSARAEYERRRARDTARRRTRFGRFAPLVEVLSGPRATTEAWGRGAQGEEEVGLFLDRAVGSLGTVLHDRRIPGRRTNLDHLVVVPSGVWVVDTKRYRGRLEQRQAAGWFVSRRILTVGGRDQSRLVTSLNGQRDLVGEVIGPRVPLRGALCFTGVEVSWFARPFLIDGVLVTWPRALAKTLQTTGALTPRAIANVAATLDERFVPYED